MLFVSWNLADWLFSCLFSCLLPTEYPYKFVKVLKHQQLTEKDTITLLCELDDPTGDVQWFKNGEEVKPDKRFVVSNLRQSCCAGPRLPIASRPFLFIRGCP